MRLSRPVSPDMEANEVLHKHPALGLLEVAVPLRIADLRTYSEDARMAMAREAGQYIASRGDDLMFRSKKGKSAEAFNQLATGLAALAFSPGGVTFAGMKWEA
jgi:hypothetical protein